MKNIHIALTDEKMVLCVLRPSDLPNLLRGKGNVIEDWFYNIPKELESFFMENPELKEIFAKGFGYWVLCKTIPKMKENHNQYGRKSNQKTNISNN